MPRTTAYQLLPNGVVEPLDKKLLISLLGLKSAIKEGLEVAQTEMVYASVR